MARDSGFFSWWFSALRDAFSGRAEPQLALILSDAEIALEEAGFDRPLGMVQVRAPDREERIETLRAIAERRAGAPAGVELRLPVEQTMLMDVTFSAEEAATPRETALTKARDALNGREDIAVDVALAKPAKSGTVAATIAIALQSTVREACEHAKAWGFAPRRVTGVERGTAFPDGPTFFTDDADAEPARLPRIALIAAAAAVVLSGAAAMRALSERTKLAERMEAQVAALPTLDVDLDGEELALARFAHSASMAYEERIEATPIWRVLDRAFAALPQDAGLTELTLADLSLRLSGTAGSIDLFADAMEREQVFSAPRFVETSARGGEARFILDLTVAPPGGVWSAP